MSKSSEPFLEVLTLQNDQLQLRFPHSEGYWVACIMYDLPCAGQNFLHFIKNYHFLGSWLTNHAMHLSSLN